MANDKVITREEARSFDRYLFDTDFFELDVTEEVAEPAEEPLHMAEPEAPSAPPAPAHLTQEDLAQAESAGYALGLAEGKQQATEDFKKELQTHTNALADALKEIDLLKEELSTELSHKAIHLLAGVLPTLLADAQQNYPEALLKRTAETLAKTLADEKVLTVRTAPKTKDYLLEHITAAPKLAGKLAAEQIIETPELNPGDCIIEWATGGITLSHDDILQQITNVLLASGTAPKKATKAAKAEDPIAEDPSIEAEAPQGEAETTPIQTAGNENLETAEPTADEAEQPQDPAPNTEADKTI